MDYPVEIVKEKVVEKQVPVEVVQVDLVGDFRKKR